MQYPRVAIASSGALRTAAMSQPVRASAAQTSKLGAFAPALVALQLKHIPT